MDKIYDVVIVGCGAAGMMAAITAASRGKSVIIIEKNEQPGKKILATGNGKCNFTNKVWKEDSFRGDSQFAWKVYNSFDYNKTIEFFEAIGVYHYDRDGYCYPYSRQAKSVNDCLLHRLYQLKVEIITSNAVSNIYKKDNLFYIVSDNNVCIKGTKVILTTGGKAYKSLGSDGSGYRLAKSFGHNITKLYPALVKLKVKENLKQLDGVRVLGEVKLLSPDKTYISTGEIIFGKNHISGIPIFELSRYGAEEIEKGNKVCIELDLFPDMSFDDMLTLINKRRTTISDKTYRLLIGLINEKLAGYINEDKNNAEDKYLVNSLKGLRFNVEGIGDFDGAQVTAGGIDTTEINSDTMESKLVTGLYFAGEIVNVDGTCGGYNLQWAWSSGYVAGMNI